MSDSDSDLNDCVEDVNDIPSEYIEKPEKKAEEVESTVMTTDNHANKKTALERKMEVPMDKVIFGDKEGLIKKLARAVDEDSSDNQDDGTDEENKEGLRVENTADLQQEDGKPLVQSLVSKATKKKASKRKPAWIDEDDEEIQLGEIKRETKYTGPLDHLRMDKTYKEYLTARFTRIVAQPKWANLDKKPEKLVDSDDEELLHTVGFLAKPKANAISSHHIQIKRLKDLNRATYAEGSISSVCFHPTSTAALVSGSSGVATIYSIDGKKNEKLHSIGFRDYPVRCARITPCGTKAIFGSIHRFFYSYDLLSAQEIRHVLPKKVTTMRNFEISHCGRYLAAAGRFGELHLFDAPTKELIHTFKQENDVAAIRFTADSHRIICSSKSCDVNIFSIRTQRLEHLFTDDGCIKGSALDLAPNQRMLATGSREGVVNVYDFEKVLTSKTPQPEKIIMNLTTAISAVHFNHSSELLAMSSGDVDSAVKLVHFPTGTVYANFPGFQCKTGNVNTVQFSPASGFLALGNRKKEVPLFRLKHFQNY